MGATEDFCDLVLFDISGSGSGQFYRLHHQFQTGL